MNCKILSAKALRQKVYFVPSPVNFLVSRTTFLKQLVSKHTERRTG